MEPKTPKTPKARTPRKRSRAKTPASAPAEEETAEAPEPVATPAPAPARTRRAEPAGGPWSPPADALALQAGAFEVCVSCQPSTRPEEAQAVFPPNIDPKDCEPVGPWRIVNASGNRVLWRRVYRKV